MNFLFFSLILSYVLKDSFFSNYISAFSYNLLFIFILTIIYIKQINENGNFFISKEKIIKTSIPSAITVSSCFIILFIFSIFFYDLNLNDYLFSISAIISYIYIIPAILFGIIYYFDRQNNFLLLKIIFYIIILISIIQFVQSQSSFLTGETFGDTIFPSKEHNAHTYHSNYFFMASSIFNSGKKFSYFILFLGLIFLANNEYKNKKNKLLFFLILIGIITSGSRTVLVIYLGIIGLYGLLFIDGKLKASIFIIPGLIIFLLFLPLLLQLQLASQLILFFDYLFSLSTLDDYYIRVLEFFDISAFKYFTLTGHEFGGYGQTRELSSIQNNLFDLKYGNSGLNDGGINKLIIETGAIGTLFIIFHYLIIIILCFKGIKSSVKFKTKYLYFLSMIPFAWLILFFKAHAIHTDLLLQLLFYFSIGLIIKSLNINYHLMKNRV